MKNSDQFTDRAQSAIERARLAATDLGHSYVGTEHILIGIAAEGDGLGAKILRDNGFDAEKLAQTVEHIAGRGDPGVPVGWGTAMWAQSISSWASSGNRTAPGPRP